MLPSSPANTDTHAPARALRPRTKLTAVLSWLAAGRSLNRFEAERQLHDHTLNSTIPQIEARGVRVAREWETVPAFGGRTRVRRYWLEEPERSKARQLVGAG